jgi:ankyrin repeat protein
VLHLSVLSGHIPIIQLVLESSNGALINLQDSKGNTALHLAINVAVVCENGEDCVKTLLFFYPDLTLKNHRGKTVFESAMALHAWNIFLLLCKHNESVGITTVPAGTTEDSWLVCAYRDRHVETLHWLLEHGGNWNDIDSKVIPCLNMMFYTIFEFYQLHLVLLLCRRDVRYWRWFAKSFAIMI